MSAIAAGLLLTWGSVAHAQVDRLPPELISNVASLSAAQEEQVGNFVKAAAPDLKLEREPLKIKRARASLLEPLQDPKVSAPFRLAYSRALEPVLVEMVGSPSQVVVVNGLVIAGELATEPGVAIIEKQLDSKDPVVRYSAVRALGLSLEAMGKRTPALAAARASKMLDTLAQIMSAKDVDPKVYDAAARGLAAGLNVNDVRDRAAALLSAQLTAALKQQAGQAPDSARLDSLIVAGSVLRDAASGLGGRPKLAGAAARDALKLGSEMLSTVAALLKGKDFPAIVRDDSEQQIRDKKDLRLQIRQIAALGEAIVSVTAPEVPTGKIAEALNSARSEDDARFLDGVGELLKKLAK